MGKNIPYNMTVTKKRYLILESTKFISKNLVLALIKANYGLFGLSFIDFLEVVEEFSNNQIYIFKVNIEGFAYAKSVLEKEEGVKIILISGILRKAKKKLYRILSNK
ncbi:hypothetical protein NUSPORA_02394 [Nucleospora cyclopteri]